MLDDTPDNPDDGLDGTPRPRPLEGPEAAQAADLMPIIYEELRRLAHHYMSSEPLGHTLQTTALVHEAYLRLAAQTRAVWKSRTHFYAVAALMVRRVLVDHARARLAAKRGGRASRDADASVPSLPLVELPDEEPLAPLDVLALDEALSELAALDERQCRIVELRYFGGLSVEETAEALDVSIGTVKGDWRVARAWLKLRLQGEIDG